MKTIGFVDYFIDEWHSNNSLAFINELCEEYGYDFKVRYAWAETDTFEGKISTDEWCSLKGIERCNSIEEVCEKSDYLMILAPANPEKHLKYAETVLKYGKHTFIDKTFAPCSEEAEKMFELAEKYGTRLFSASSLRYADELDEYKDGFASLIIRGGGRCFEEYVVHMLEILVKLLGTGVDKVKVFPNGKQVMCVIEYKNGKSCFFEYANSNGFSVVVEDENGKDVGKNLTSPYFKNMTHSILGFFENGELPVAKEDTLEIIRVRDALLEGVERPDEWIKIN